MKETKNSIIVFMTAIFLATIIDVYACEPLGDGGELVKEENGEAVVLQSPVIVLSPEEQLAVNNELVIAVKLGDEKEVTDAIARGAQGCLRRNKGQYPLLIEAVRSKTPVEKVKLLLGAKVQIEEQDTYCHTAFHHAAIEGNIEVMELLRKAGARIDIPDSVGESPLALAVFLAEKSAVQWLLRAGVAIDTPNYRGATALMKSVSTVNGFDLVDMLLGAKASVNKQDRKGNTALMRLSRYDLKNQVVSRWLAAIRKFILAGADPFIRNVENKSAWSEATEDIKLVMRNAREERELGTFTSEILRRNIRPPRNIRLQLPEHIACLVEEFATAPFSDCDIARRGRELAQSRTLWLARTEDDNKEDDGKQE